MNPLQSLKKDARAKIEFIVGLDEQRDFLDSIITRTVALVEEKLESELGDWHEMKRATSILQALRETKDEV